MFIANTFIFLFLLIFVFRFAIAFLGVKNKTRKIVSPAIINQDYLSGLASYSILLPVHKENKQTLENLVFAISRLIYDKSKLEALLIIDEADHDTVKIINNLRLPNYFRVIVVPDSYNADISPKGKPRSCNYALKQAKNEYCVIYDGEDKPEPLQLIKAQAFFKDNNDIDVIQANLLIENNSKVILTRMFFLEYLFWFRFQANSIRRFNLLFPLGGTSYHIKRDYFKELGFLDESNVTEDAHLGMKIFARGGKVSTFNSYTIEEAPYTLKTWLMQRSRWMKGFMQTFLSACKMIFINKNLDKSVTVAKKISLFVNVFFMIFASFFVPMSSFLHAITLKTKIINVNQGLTNHLTIWFFIFIFTIVSLYLYALIHKQRLLKLKHLFSVVLLPFYYILHSIAGFIAFFELITNNRVWHKTSHSGSMIVKTKTKIHNIVVAFSFVSITIFLYIL